MEIVTGRDVDVAALVGASIGAAIVPPYVGIGVERDGVLVGGAIFNVYTGSDIYLTIAGKGILRRPFMRALAEYAFIKAGCRRVSMTVKLHNECGIHKLAEKCGFVVEGMRKRAYPDDDGVLYGLLPENFPWLKFEVHNG